MTLEVRAAGARGQADHGWLQSWHTFSFAQYRDPQHRGFGSLRVLNQDTVQPGRGFRTHPHQDMEILSYVVSGALQHKDTLGTGSVIRPGEVQLMSAGSGIAHSEKNASTEATVEFLQIWLLPAESGSAPSYQQKDFGDRPGLLLVVSPDGRGGSLTVKQDADVYRALLALGDSVTLQRRGARAWVQVVHGPLEVNGVLLQPGDGLKVDQPGPLHLTAHGAVNALLFDLA